MPFPSLSPAFFRLALCLAAVGLLSACASGSRTHVSRTSAEYAARAKGDYTPPGPPSDPWGPFIAKASARFDVPEQWIREVMRVESGGRMYQGGRLTTSHAGAMGLMQVMPGTYEELRIRYGLDDDPYHPYDNIMAGTAYIREMYDLYGSPGFLAAYNAGPRRFEDYAIRNRGLPTETRRYVARIAPNIAAYRPARESDAAVLAMFQIPNDIPPGPRFPRGQQPAPVALAQAMPSRPAPDRAATSVTAVALPPPGSSAAASRPAMVAAVATAPPASAGRGFSLITPAVAGSLPARPAPASGGGWAIQVGAFSNEALARAAADAARGQARDVLARARPAVGAVRQGSATLYRARLTGLSREAAMQACELLSRGRGSCIVLSPDAQS